MRDAILAEISAERDRQDAKWGELNHDQFYWIGILGEEFGEVCKDAIEFSRDKYRKELIQTAAVAVSMLESLDRGNWDDRMEVRK